MEKLATAMRSVSGESGHEPSYEAIQLEKPVANGHGNGHAPKSPLLSPTSPRFSPEEVRLAIRDERHAANDEDDDDDADEEKPLSGAPIKSVPTRQDQREGTRASFIFWVLVNIVATLVIILANKQILSNPTLKGAPTLFVAYHFALTGLTLHIASSKFLGAFERKEISSLAIAPLVIVFAAHTVVTNASLALLAVPIYQQIRILVTPFTVLINLLLYRKTISLQSTVTLVFVCAGIAMTLWSENNRKGAAVSVDTSKNTTFGFIIGMMGVFLSALYTVWVAVYLPKLQVSSMQLLHRQSPLGCILLLVATPFFDTLPVWSTITPSEWGLLFLSGMCAVLINLSQFFIISGSSALSSTIVGHSKTILIVGIGWITANVPIPFESGLGIFIALAGIIAYSIVGMRQSKK